MSTEGAAELVRPGDWVDYGAVLAQPDVFDSALAARVDELHDVSIRGCLSLHPRAVLEVDPEREHFAYSPAGALPVGAAGRSLTGDPHARTHWAAPSTLSRSAG